MELESKLKNIISWNLGIYFCITFIEILLGKGSRLLDPNGTLGVIIMISSVFTVGLQILTNIILSIISFSKGDSDSGKSYLVSLSLILLIGYPLCFAGFML